MGHIDRTAKLHWKESCWYGTASCLFICLFFWWELAANEDRNQETETERKGVTTVNNVLYHLEGFQAIPELLNNVKAKPAIIELAKKGYWTPTIDTMGIANDLLYHGVASELAQDYLICGSALQGLPPTVLAPSSQALRCHIIEIYPEGFKLNESN